MSRNKPAKSNLNLALLFVVIFLFFIFVSFLFKTITLINESRFDGKNKLNVEVIDKQGLSVVSFSPNDKSINIIKFGKVNKDSYQKDYGILIDSKI